MTSRSHVPPKSRRRGKLLECALLDAAWEELTAHGYSNLTMGAVASRAKTSRTILARRWPTRPDLVLAALKHHMEGCKVVVEDQGDLRTELIDFVDQTVTLRVPVIILVYQMNEYFVESDSDFGALRKELLGNEASLLDTIFDRAITRGEIEGGTLTPITRILPQAVLAYLIVTSSKLTPQQIVLEIVDDILLPLLTRPTPVRSTQRGSKHPVLPGESARQIKPLRTRERTARPRVHRTASGG